MAASRSLEGCEYMSTEDVICVLVRCGGPTLTLALPLTLVRNPTLTSPLFACCAPRM